MKVIRIKKIFSGGEKIHFELFFNPTQTNEYIHGIVEDWCEQDPAGHNYEYEFEWREETNPEILRKVIREKQIELQDKIDICYKRLKQLEEFKNKL